ncbi:adenine deaminase C-terminal domain-containing protein [Lysinibacillus piscis]|uniref:adenine deaminase n=1 Tax=Lysinibacillus piscis TaxID=2518931 RepID=A0ABQ5NQC9_9BACI|nr:adenine deaminase C-terminal domain-containing protein [Lysinibacillus sp. KH24]GLC90440.1 adenine deaminase [Lysinibacillus sp. KH24]
MEPIWKIAELRQQVAVIDGKQAPHIVLQNARYLHSMLKQWVVGNIWILGDRIVYAGERMPPALEGTEIVDCTNKTIVPGYIEPHVHPFQLYHPQSFADFCGQLGTTSFISDNLNFVLSLSNKKAFSIMDDLKKLPFTFYWWTRFDSQTDMQQEEEIFSNTSIVEWLERQDVLLGGELTGWPRLLHGDDQMLYRMQLAKGYCKKVEGHFPGASERTLARMKLFGADGDHEAMTVEEVERRIMQGYAVTLRHSSIRPDLPNLLKDIVAKELPIFDHLMMTTDGSTPTFHQDGVMDKCIQVALDAGVSPIDAYQMASYNIARYYNMANLHGFIATGRFASLNILQDEWHPVPESVLSKGVWLKRDGQRVHQLATIDYSAIPALQLDFSLTEQDFQFSMPFGIELVNDVITKPYNSMVPKIGQLAEHDESYLILLSKDGSWRVNTMIKGFATNVQGFASSYSNTGDIILIGKNKEAMTKAFEEMKAMQGGIVLVDKKEVVASIPLSIGGTLYDGTVETLMQKERLLKEALAERGYSLGDAIYTLLFLQSTHLPYIRITPTGIVDVLKNKLLLPAMMRS